MVAVPVDLPLKGLRVVTLAEIFPGPYATSLLADLGADVVKLERAEGGDPARRWPALFDALNRGKRSLALDLRQPSAREAARRVVQDADVLVEGARPGAAARLGLGYEELASKAPRLIYVSLSAFGQTGPYRTRPAHDLTIQGMAGALHEDVVAGTPSPPSAIPLADLAAGLQTVVGILALVARRSRTGRGGRVDVAMLDALLSFMTTGITPALNDEPPLELPPREPAYGAFATSDGRLLTLSISYSDAFWQRLCGAIGEPDIASIPARERRERVVELRERVAEAIARLPWEECSTRLEEADIPFGPAYTFAQAARDPHVTARGLVKAVDSGETTRQYLSQPITFDEAVPGPTRPAPRLGEHTAEVLAEAGVRGDEIDDLVRSRAALDASPLRDGT